MVRICGVDLQSNKKIVYALTSVYGIGLARSKKILNQSKINCNTRTYELTDELISNLRDVLDRQGYNLESDLRRYISLNIKRLSEINCYRGKRHRQSLPLRGQRTRTNARTKRGSKKTMPGKKK
uniref:ribosomal protein S13 n=1 Tax=Fibrocapsa japonica TaxID=94617 RepID=UPI002113C4B3|nr:ribosomal protein S13 [Fibrocapsa japonica]UTE95140.1 ribosomal protein S13 [Fibrocapsa japonica]